MRQSCANQAECKAGRHRFAREISVALLVNNLLITLHPPLKYVRFVILIAFAAVGTILFSSCGTTGVRALPAYEPPLVKSNFQTVRTTAYTHTESDHLQFSDHNALGGQLQAAGPPIHRAENTRLPLEIEGDYRIVSNTPAPQPFSMNDDEPKPAVRKATRATTTTTTTTTRTVKVVRGKRVVVKTKPQPPKIGSAASDWSRWPVGTTFRLLSTGQIYRIDDYGWVLSGRNTIYLYMANARDMNTCGARQESLQFLQSHQYYRHIKRIVLELEGRNHEAASLR